MIVGVTLEVLLEGYFRLRVTESRSVPWFIKNMRDDRKLLAGYCDEAEERVVREGSWADVQPEYEHYKRLLIGTGA